MGGHQPGKMAAIAVEHGQGARHRMTRHLRTTRIAPVPDLDPGDSRRWRRAVRRPQGHKRRHKRDDEHPSGPLGRRADRRRSGAKPWPGHHHRKVARPVGRGVITLPETASRLDRNTVSFLYLTCQYAPKRRPCRVVRGGVLPSEKLARLARPGDAESRFFAVGFIPRHDPTGNNRSHTVEHID
jgi:hypothetical protein